LGVDHVAFYDDALLYRPAAVSRVLWKKRKAYSLGIPKNNWLMG